MEVMVGIVFLILWVAISVAIARWVFRINDIVEKLDIIIKLMRNNQKDG
jgi:hypothetical protein